MKQTLNKIQIVGMLLDDEYAKWSRPAAESLADYYEDLENDTGEEIEFDRVSIRCDWQEFNNAKEIADQYMDPSEIEGLDEDELIDAVETYLQDHTLMIKLPNDNGYLIQQF